MNVFNRLKRGGEFFYKTFAFVNPFSLGNDSQHSWSQSLVAISALVGLVVATVFITAV